MRATDGTSEVSFLVGISRHRAYLPRRNGTSIRPSPFFTDSKWIRQDRSQPHGCQDMIKLDISSTSFKEEPRRDRVMLRPLIGYTGIELYIHFGCGRQRKVSYLD